MEWVIYIDNDYDHDSDGDSEGERPKTEVRGLKSEQNTITSKAW